MTSNRRPLAAPIKGGDERNLLVVPKPEISLLKLYEAFQRYGHTAVLEREIAALPERYDKPLLFRRFRYRDETQRRFLNAHSVMLEAFEPVFQFAIDSQEPVTRLVVPVRIEIYRTTGGALFPTMKPVQEGV